MADIGSTAEIKVSFTVSVDSGDLPTDTEFVEQLLKELFYDDLSREGWYILAAEPVSDWQAEELT